MGKKDKGESKDWSKIPGLKTNEVAYVSRVLDDRYKHLDGVLTMAHLEHTAKLEAGAEMQLIQKIQKVLVPQ